LQQQSCVPNGQQVPLRAWPASRTRQAMKLHVNCQKIGEASVATLQKHLQENTSQRSGRNAGPN
jgi:hypothetical protein